MKTIAHNIIFLILCILFLCVSCKVQEIKNGKETYAIVVDNHYFDPWIINQPREKYVGLWYFPNDKDSCYYSVPYTGLMKNGDKYLIRFDSLDPQGPDKTILYHNKPIFLKSDVTDTVYGTLTVASRNKKDNLLTYVEFSYDIIVNNDTMKRQTFKRGQQIFSKEFPTVKVGDTCKIAYLKSNPINSIIYLEKSKIGPSK
ncbi:MAG: hypothetical protein JNL24_02695 [Bacteroidia bacterium]|nr:hypothetical protein [Bacteroidia bacterium]